MLSHVGESESSNGAMVLSFAKLNITLRRSNTASKGHTVKLKVSILAQILIVRLKKKRVASSSR